MSLRHRLVTLALASAAVMAAPLFARAARAETAGAATNAAADSVSIRAVVADLDSAWANADADRWAAHYLPDAEFINMFGMLLPDAQAIRARHHMIFRGVFKGSREAGALRRVRFLGPDVAIADVDIDVTGYSGLPAGARETAPGVLRTRMRHVLKRIDGKWWIAATQNTAVAPLQ